MFVKGKRLVGHTGKAHGLYSCMYFCPDEDWGIVCICSSAKPDKVNGIRKCYYVFSTCSTTHSSGSKMTDFAIDVSLLPNGE